MKRTIRSYFSLALIGFITTLVICTLISDAGFSPSLASKKPAKKKTAVKAAKKPVPAAVQSIIFTEQAAAGDLFLTRGKNDFEIGKFDRIYARVKIPAGLAVSSGDEWNFLFRYPLGKTGEEIAVNKSLKPEWVSPDNSVYEFIVFSKIATEEMIAPPTLLGELLEGIYSRGLMHATLTASVVQPTKTFQPANLNFLRPLAQSKLISSDDGKIKMELPVDSPWALLSNTADKITLNFTGNYDEYPPTFMIQTIPVGEKTDPRSAQVEFVRQLEDQKRTELGSDYFPMSKASIIANTDPLQFKFSFAVDDPQTGAKRPDYRNWKGYVVYKDGTIYLLLGEAFDMFKYEEQFDNLANLVKIN